MSMRRRRGERGAISVEFALTLPIMLLLLIGGLSFGLAFVTQYQMANAVTVAARQCSYRDFATNPPDEADAQVYFQNAFGAWSRRCTNGGGALTYSTDDIDGVTVVNIEVSCDYDPGFGGRWLASQNVQPLVLTASAGMPVQ